MREETQQVLERMLVLLTTKPPHLATALKQLDDLLQKPPCLAETDVARKTVVVMLERLVLPVLANDPEMRIVGEELQSRIREAGTLSGARVPLEKAAQWLANTPAREGGEEGLPALLSRRLLTVLRMHGDADPPVVEEANRLLGQERHANPWPEIEALLHRVVDGPGGKGHHRREEEDEGLRSALREGLESLLAESRDADEGEWVKMLRQRGKELRQRARRLAARIDESRDTAERLRTRLRQLEEALTRARSDGFLDPVTGLPDRFAFSAQLRRHLERSVHLREPFALALVHVRHLTVLVGELGREGEARLVDGLVGEIRRHLREEEYLARLSVERFVILFPRSDENRAEITARELERMLTRTQFALEDRVIHLEAYCGSVALGPEMSGREMLEMTERVAAVARSESRGREPVVTDVRTCVC
ncbi:MAG: GGDEF domain-containing protein [Magnetococcales bacterium]|nr:GGDEF domain-containing protein [Magnetococcales bacterium]